MKFANHKVNFLSSLGSRATYILSKHRKRAALLWSLRQEVGLRKSPQLMTTFGFKSDFDSRQQNLLIVNISWQNIKSKSDLIHSVPFLMYINVEKWFKNKLERTEVVLGKDLPRGIFCQISPKHFWRSILLWKR